MPPAKSIYRVAFDVPDFGVLRARSEYLRHDADAARGRLLLAALQLGVEAQAVHRWLPEVDNAESRMGRTSRLAAPVGVYYLSPYRLINQTTVEAKDSGAIRARPLTRVRDAAQYCAGQVMRESSMFADALLHAVALVTGLSLTADAAGAAFRLTSAEIKPGATIAAEQTFNGFGCSGQNVSPSLEWSGAPKDTKSFAVLVHDPDAPTGGAGWWHWVVFNIPAGTTVAERRAGKADGSGDARGRCKRRHRLRECGLRRSVPARSGDKPHRYIFTVYALKTDKLDVPKGATASLVGFMVNANAIGKATLIGMYGRKK